MNIKLLNSNIFALKGTNNRYWHLGSLARGAREFMVFFDKIEARVYIEEVTGGSLVRIDDDSLAKEVEVYAVQRGLINLSRTAGIV